MALEALLGLSRIGVAAIRLSGVFSRAEPVRRLIELCRCWKTPLLRALPAANRGPGGADRLRGRVQSGIPRASRPPPQETPGAGPRPSRGRPGATPGPSRVWLEARGYAEAAALAGTGGSR